MKNNIVGNNYNLSRRLYLKNVPMVPRLLKMLNRVMFSCDIPYKADIHESVRFSHNGLGVVVNENAKVGKNTKLLQHVTLGGNMGKKRMVDGVETTAPVIGDNVLIGAGAKILGPVKIGNNVVIGAGAVVLIDVPDHGVAVGVPAKVHQSS